MNALLRSNKLKLLPIGLILCIVPLIVFVKIVTVDDTIVEFWTGQREVVDFFSYYKSTWFIGLSIGALIFCVTYILYCKKKIYLSKVYIPLLIYGFLTFLSTILSEYPSQALWGFPDRYEGFIVILCYLLVCIITSHLIDSEFDIKYLLTFLSISVTIVSLIGIFQYFGFDLFQTQFGKELILPKAIENMASSLKFSFPIHYIYATLYNPNYVGTFFAMATPICLVAVLKCQKLLFKILAIILCILSYSSLIGSLSFTGYIGAAIAFLFVIVILRRDFIKRTNLIPLLVTAICCISMTIIMNSVADGAVFNELQISRFFPQKTTTQSQPADSSSAQLKDLTINKNVVTLYFDKNKLNISFDPEKKELAFFDENNTPLDLKYTTSDDGAVVNFINEPFKSIKINIYNQLVQIIASESTIINTTIKEDYSFSIVNPSGTITDITKAESFGFEGRELWGSSRGYIWSRSIPLVKDTILLGHGPDTFAMYFPQTDYVAKLKYLMGFYTVVDKPHNIYLQIGINTGVLSLIAFLCFFMWYVVRSLMLYFRRPYENIYSYAGVGCLSAVIAYLAAGIGNDSTICVSPIFWILVGSGIACNRLYTASQQPQQKSK